MHRVALGPRRAKAVAKNDGEWRKDGKRSQLVEHACAQVWTHAHFWPQQSSGGSRAHSWILRCTLMLKEVHVIVLTQITMNGCKMK